MTSSKQNTCFVGKEICVLIARVPGHSKPYLELKNKLDELIAENGGETVWLPCHTTFCVVAEFPTTLVRSMCVGSQFNNVAVRPSWIYRCVSENKFLSFNEDEVFYCEPFMRRERLSVTLPLKYENESDVE